MMFSRTIYRLIFREKVNIAMHIYIAGPYVNSSNTFNQYKEWVSKS